MQEIAFPGFKFQKFSGGVCPQTLLFMHGMLATHMSFRHCYTPNILSHRKVPFQEMGKSLKKALADLYGHLQIYCHLHKKNWLRIF
jgi:TRAP-type C4-dicarboxylate transport system permease large subunit